MTYGKPIGREDILEPVFLNVLLHFGSLRCFVIYILAVFCPSYFLFLNNNGFAVVQWVGEDSYSVINENQATEEIIDEGDTVSVTAKSPKGKSVIYKVKATVLKAFGEYGVDATFCFCI